MLLEEWLNLESSFGSIGDVSIVQKLPGKVKRKTAIASEDDTPTRYAHLVSVVKFMTLLTSFSKLFFFTFKMPDWL